jgi:hypothetical protein
MFQMQARVHVQQGVLEEAVTHSQIHMRQAHAGHDRPNHAARVRHGRSRLRGIPGSQRGRRATRLMDGAAGGRSFLVAAIHGCQESVSHGLDHDQCAGARGVEHRTEGLGVRGAKSGLGTLAWMTSRVYAGA